MPPSSNIFFNYIGGLDQFHAYIGRMKSEPISLYSQVVLYKHAMSQLKWKYIYKSPDGSLLSNDYDRVHRRTRNKSMNEYSSHIRGTQYFAGARHECTYNNINNKFDRKKYIFSTFDMRRI